MVRQSFLQEKEAQNREALMNILYDDVLKLLDGFQFGKIGIELSIHNGKVVKVDFTESKSTRKEVKYEMQ